MSSKKQLPRDFSAQNFNGSAQAVTIPRGAFWKWRPVRTLLPKGQIAPQDAEATLGQSAGYRG